MLSCTFPSEQRSKKVALASSVLKPEGVAPAVAQSSMASTVARASISALTPASIGTLFQLFQLNQVKEAVLNSGTSSIKCADYMDVDVESVTESAVTTSPFDLLPDQLLAQIFPSEHVAIGLQVNKKLRSVLLNHAELVTFRIAASAQGGGAGVIKTIENLRHPSAVVTLSLAGNSSLTHSLLQTFNAYEWCSKVKQLDISQTNLKPHHAEQLAGLLPHLQLLASLTLRGNEVGARGAAALCSGLASSTKLQTFDIHGNNIGNLGAKSIAAALPTWPSLTELDLGWNKISSAGALQLARALAQTPSITSLSLAENALKDEGVALIAGALPRLPSLKQLNLRWNQFGDEGALPLCKALVRCANLEALNVNENLLACAGAGFLGEVLKASRALQQLSAGWNHLGDEGAQALAPALALAAPSLASVDLRANYLSPAGMAQLGLGLRHCSGLRELRLSGNKLGAEGSAHVAALLPALPALTELELRLTEAGDAGAAALGAALQQHCGALTVLNLSGNQIGTCGAQALARALQLGLGSLESLNLGSNALGPEGAAAISGAVHASVQLRELELCWNMLGDEGAGHVAAGLAGFPNGLQRLNLAWNNIEARGAALLAQGLALSEQQQQRGAAGKKGARWELTVNVAQNERMGAAGEELARRFPHNVLLEPFAQPQ